MRVLIKSPRAPRVRTWNTVGGLTTNIVEASWLALVDALEYGLRCSDLARKRSAA